MNNEKSKWLEDFILRCNSLLFDHILQISTVVALVGFYVEWKHPELLVQYTAMVSTYLLSKKG